ncbi:hypothetical protein A2334_03335 [Candidatus Roizmanbacteria bacterium RIFOXYB2_FULL_38_10]|uniref:Uncharacterized protein n=1 Tax=Candidatus Roizmanbacteria bacterium RIFOXYD1_FULL_38_12 TaxID=1802093 RepID=A0A1F7L118_9BACT|nr:MAG: hypothetical protein A3K47_03510 [Candidatus Roizmanbacteria bacterium RIFOXYA2_FULL_38_14]OGK63830.1 MAG: hypothetical protein A3K27_03510 [Candidatus Roizmanbacteria bacterium RIFOXYA1_FULL_37_12]OGK65676.1 MAG: hypothetical protein A3K38_03510 [Candidatus Roizmanbacteria bacterium RIFOXYB1_FULL_40_23]OGK67436.1 MAG: hypothetical protein A2334_03335 [Candidatus Roizmanbacteria bacterium RIFOXYB2_FULL_38_10]OGK70081.1 MAG: hypothetical protein A3K21_03515 [Candidatus Roizmanbacteria ba
MYQSLGGRKIHYSIEGSGPPIIFVHGWGGTIQSLTPLANLFSHHTRVLLDLPGFGKSDPPEKNWGVEEYAKCISELLLKLNIKQTTYVGHSFGGSLGIYLASTSPAFINKLILCSSSYKRTGITSNARTSWIKKLPLPPLLLLALRKAAYRILYPGSDALKFPHVEENLRRVLSQDLSLHLANIHAPTLIIWGKQDIDTPLNLAEELHQKIANSKLILFDDATHGLPLKNPRGVYKEIVKFI